MKFVAIDFETATASRSSACEIGLAMVNNGRVEGVKSWLIQPPGNEYDGFNTHLHGISPEMTAECLTFGELWPEISAFIGDNILVAHNRSFDRSVMNHTLNEYGISDTGIPNTWLCTYMFAKRIWDNLPNYRLSTLCEANGINIHLSHRASNDAEAAALLMLAKLDDVIEWQSGKRISPPDVNTDADPNGYFYGKSVCFTGELNIVRAKAVAMVRDRGGITVTTVGKTTNIVVVGEYNHQTLKKGFMSSKMLKVSELLDAGYHIEIIDESQFLQLL
jgi:DNA polymerase III subunit epsilon